MSRVYSIYGGAAMHTRDGKANHANRRARIAVVMFGTVLRQPGNALRRLSAALPSCECNQFSGAVERRTRSRRSVVMPSSGLIGTAH